MFKYIYVCQQICDSTEHYLLSAKFTFNEINAY